MVNSIVSRYPCRIICLSYRMEQPEDFLQVDMGIEEGGVCAITGCDWINITVGGNHRRRVPLLILPHLVSDLPVQLVWKLGPMEERETLLRLQKMTNRVIFDSDGAPSTSNFCCALAGDMSLFQSDITDLNWAYLQGWRSLLAEAFQAPAQLALLKQAKRIEIQYNHRLENFCKCPELPARMLQAWLASRLGWAFQGLEGNTIKYQNGVAVVFNPITDNDLPAASITSITLQGEDNQRLVLQVEKGMQRVRVDSPTPHTLPLREMAREEAVLDQLFIPHTSRQLKRTLEVLCLIEGDKK
jgi:glucose-6-phosphate dehydrogenase assembly protein OpcA